MTNNETPSVRPINGKCQVVHACRQTEQLANAFLQRLRVRLLSENTATAYAYDLVSLFRWLAAARKNIFNFSCQDLFDYAQAQTESGAKPRSINRRLVVCDLFLRFLLERSIPVHSSHLTRQLGAAAAAPRKGLWQRKRGIASLRVKVPSTIVEPLKAEEVNQLLCGVRYHRDLGIILLMTLVGLRRHEVLGVQMSDVDFESKLIRIKGKGGRERAMPMPLTVTSVLCKYLEYERPRSLQSTFFLILDGPRRGEPMTAAGLRSFFRKRRRASRVLQAHPHRLRHTFAYSMVKAGVSIAVLQKMMGHARYSTTLQYVALRAEDIAGEYLKAMKTIEGRCRIQGPGA